MNTETPAPDAADPFDTRMQPMRDQFENYLTKLRIVYELLMHDDSLERGDKMHAAMREAAHAEGKLAVSIAVPLCANVIVRAGTEAGKEMVACLGADILERAERLAGKALATHAIHKMKSGVTPE